MSRLTPTQPPPAPAVLAPPAPAAPPIADAPAAGPLSPAHLEELARAQQRAKKIRRAGATAMFNGCTVAVFAGASLLFAAAAPLFGEVDVVALVMGLGLSVVAWNEFRGRRGLRRFDLRAPRRLGWNQLGLMALLIGYCAWQIAHTLLGPDPYADAIAAEPMLAGTLGPIGDLHRTLTIAVYGGVIAGTVVFQGLTALYYFTRRKHLLAWLNQTPAWVVQLQRQRST